MHILLIHQAFVGPNEPGGTRHLEMARYLEKQGHQITIITSPISYLTGKAENPRSGQRKTREAVSQNITILRVPVYQALHKSFVHRLFNFFSFMFNSFTTGLHLKKVDLVWGTTPPIFQSVSALLIAKLKRVPFLLEVRDLWPAFAVAVGVLKSPFLIKASEWLEKFLYKNADQLVINSPGFEKHVISTGADKVCLIPNGIDTEMFTVESDRDEIRKELGFGNKFVALYAGAHGMSNDLGIVLKAAHILRKNHQILFVLVGDGKDKSALMEEAEKLKLKNILFIPSVKKEKIAETLSAADACIAILKPIEMYKTTYPNKVFDYMAAGRPVLCAIDGVIRQVVEDANCGKFVQPGNPQLLADAIMKLDQEPKQTIQMGVSGKEYVFKHFNRDDFSGKFGKLIIEMRK